MTDVDGFVLGAVGKRRTKDLVLPDAELSLPDDKLPEFRMLVARSFWFGGDYQSLAAMIEKRKKVEARFAADCAEWQREITPPCYVQYGVRGPDDSRMLVYGRIPDVEDFILSEKGAGGRIGPDAEKFARRLRHRMQDALRRGWLYGEWYSIGNPLGEWAAIPKAVIQEVLTEAKFKELEAKAWG